MQIGATPIPMLVVSDTLIRASIPPGAATGSITVLDHDGNQVSPAPFTVRSTTTTPPEETPRGREALDVLILALAYKNRGDAVGIANAFARSVVVQTTDGVQVLDYPTGSAVTPADVTAHQQSLAFLFPDLFMLRRMVIVGTAVEVFGDVGGNNGLVRFLLRQGSGGFQIVSLTTLV